MPHVIRISRTGGPEVLEWAEIPMPVPAAGEVLIRHTAIGLNFVDTYFRGGLYPVKLPMVLGSEGAGVVEAVGPGVTSPKIGERVVYQGVNGSYSEYRVAPAARLIVIPDGISDRVAAAAFLKGVTVQYLIRRTFRVEKHHAVLWHAASGGVGQIACQWVKSIGATLIGTAGSDEKAALAKSLGCDHVINYTRENFAERVKEITGGEGLDVVYDSVGKDTFPASLDCLKPMGMWVTFGNASGPVPAFPPRLLQDKGSLFATRPTTGHYLASRADLEQAAAELFQVIENGTVKMAIEQTFALRDVAEAHRALEGRKTTGATVLIP